MRTPSRLLVLTWGLVGCGTAPQPTSRTTPPPSIAASATAKPADASDAAYFPLVAGATYDYEAQFGTKRMQVRRVVRVAAIADGGEVFTFVDADADENPSIGSNSFGLGAYRIDAGGVYTADAYFFDDLAKVQPTGVQVVLKFPIVVGATTTLHGGKRLETTVVGPETVTVPAGTFACLRLDQREVWETVTHEGSVWLARGVGTVKRVYVTGRLEVLTAFHVP